MHDAYYAFDMAGSRTARRNTGQRCLLVMPSPSTQFLLPS